MLQQEQVKAFNTTGYVRVCGAVPKSDVEEMCDQVWALMAKMGLQRNDPTSWRNDEHRTW